MLSMLSKALPALPIVVPLLAASVLAGLRKHLPRPAADCIAILSAASRITDTSTLIDLDYKHLGLSRNGMEVAATFLIERDCFTQHRDINGLLAVGGLSLQGRMRLEQLSNG